MKIKLKNILVAVDFSEKSDFAIARAIEIARETKANLTLLHVVQRKYSDNFIDNQLKKLLPKWLWLTTEEYKENLIKEKIHSLSQYKLNIKSVIIPKGNPAIKILQYARKNKMDLLILGAHGKYSIHDTFVGTTTEYIAKKTKCPALIVKCFPKMPYKKILIPVDFSKISKKILIYTLRCFPNSNIKLLHVGDYEYEEILQNEAKKELISNKQISKLRKSILFYLENKIKILIKGYRKKLDKHPYDVVLGYPSPAIIKKAKNFKNDLIIMGTQGHGREHYLFIGSVANRVLKESTTDVLLIPS